MSDENHVFCAFVDVVTNSSTLRACSFKWKIHSRIIKNLLDEYYPHNLFRTRQEKEPLVETSNQNHITRWAQEQLGLNHGNHTYTDWEMLTACKIQGTCRIHIMLSWNKITEFTIQLWNVIWKNLSTTSVYKCVARTSNVEEGRGVEIKSVRNHQYDCS